MGLDPRHALLLGAIVGSTDAAAVFSLLRQAGLRLPERLAATLEIESGLNDPMAVFLVIAVIASLQHHAGPAEIALLLARQAGFGALLGWGGGGALAWGLRKLKVGAEHGGLLSLVILSGGIALFGLAGLIGGSGFLAVYLFGVRLRAKAEEATHAASSALDGFAWGAQATMFVLLGLLVTPHEMLSALPVGLAIAAMLVFVARPLAVWLCLAPLGFSLRQCLFVGWVGLRGAVPIVLALFPLLDHVPGAGRFFHIAFAVVLVSLLLQGTTLGGVARALRVVLPTERPPGEQPPMLGRLTLDGELPVEDVFSFFELPLPQAGGTTLRDWMAASLARGHGKGDSVEWHGARFEIVRMHDDRIQRVALVLDRAALAGRARG
jgi:cell volume regulation protein A